MILKNGKQYDIPEKELKVIEEYQNKNGQVVLEWDLSRGTLNPTLAKQDPNNYIPLEKKMEFPPSFPIVFEQNVVNEKGLISKFIYYTDKYIDAKTETFRYEPTHDTFKNVLYVTDVEKQWFLIFCCPFVANGVAGKLQQEKRPGYRPWLRIKMEENDAVKKLEFRRLSNKVDNYILEDAKPAELRSLAGSYRILNFNDLDLNVLREKLIEQLELTAISGSRERNYIEMEQRIKSLGKPKLDDEVAGIVTKALSLRAIKYTPNTRTFQLQDTSGKAVGPLCTIHKSVSNKDAAFERMLKEDGQLLTELKDHVKSFEADLMKSSKAAEKKDEK